MGCGYGRFCLSDSRAAVSTPCCCCAESCTLPPPAAAAAAAAVLTAHMPPSCRCQQNAVLRPGRCMQRLMCSQPQVRRLMHAHPGPSGAGVRERQQWAAHLRSGAGLAGWWRHFCKPSGPLGLRSAAGTLTPRQARWRGSPGVRGRNATELHSETAAD